LVQYHVVVFVFGMKLQPCRKTGSSGSKTANGLKCRG
jgi:hypothetical protein